MNTAVIARFSRAAIGTALLSVTLGGCALWSSAETEGAPRKELALAVTDSHALVSFNAGQPARILTRKPLTGLPAGERLVGIDFRVARGQLFALSDKGRLYRIDTATAAMTPVGNGIGIALSGRHFGVDFSPTVDRIRVVSDTGQNLRLHPDTGAAVDADPQTPGIQTDTTLAYAASDPHAGRTPGVQAAAYTYNKDNDKITTNYAIDAAQGTLIMQGSREGVTPVVHTNTGRLFTVGALGVGQFERVSFDIADISNAGFAALTRAGESRSRWFLINLDTGAATLLGTIGTPEPVLGVAIEP